MNDRFPNTQDTISKINSRLEQLNRNYSQREETSLKQNSTTDKTDRKQTLPIKKVDNNRRSRRESRLRSERFLKENSQTLDRPGRNKAVRTRRLRTKQSRRVRKLDQREDTPILRPFSYEKGEIFVEPRRTYSMNGDCVWMTGVEFLSPIIANPVGTAFPNIGGDIIFSIPLAPITIPGTEIYKEAQLWTKWRFKEVALRYIPCCPSTIAGALLAFGDTDIAIGNFGITSDPNARIREAMSRKGAKIFHPFMQTIIDVPIPETTKTVWFDTFLDPESQFTVPAVFYVMLESPVIEPGASGNFALGQLLLDYSIEFCVKMMIDSPTLSQPIRNGDGPVLFSTVFATNAEDDPIAFLPDVWFSIGQNQILQVIALEDLESSTPPGHTYDAKGPMSNTAFRFLSHGSIIYLFSIVGQGSNYYCTTSIETAILKDYTRALQWNQTYLTTDDINFAWQATVIPISSDL